MAYTLVQSELIADNAITSAKLETNITVSGTLNVTGQTTLATHLNMGSSDKIKLGAGGLLEIYHNGTNGYIENSTGNLYIADTNGNIHIQAKTNEDSIVAVADAGVTLFFNTGAKLATTNTGVTITGAVTATSLDISGDIDVDGTIETDALTINSIGGLSNVTNDLTIFSTSSGHNGLRFHANGILPTNNAGVIVDADADLGDTSYRFKDLHLSGSIKNTSDLTLDVAGDIILDADGGNVMLLKMVVVVNLVYIANIWRTNCLY